MIRSFYNMITDGYGWILFAAICFSCIIVIKLNQRSYDDYFKQGERYKMSFDYDNKNQFEHIEEYDIEILSVKDGWVQYKVFHHDTFSIESVEAYILEDITKLP